MDDNNVVYKYRSWTNVQHRDVLYHNEVYLSSPKDFNDPFDCRILPDLNLLESDEKKEKFANKLARDTSDKILKSGVDLKTIIETFVSRLKINLNKENEEYHQMFSELQDKSYGILSLTFRWDSILMWSHYADNHHGFCVGFDRQKLDNSRLFGKGGPVNYKEEFPRIDPLDDDLTKTGFIETHTKAKDWEYEEEYRLFHLDKNSLTPDKRIVKIPNDYFKEIILGLRFPETDILKMKRIADSKKCRLFIIEKKENRFEFDRIEF